MFNIYATDYAPVDPITPPCDIVPIFIGYKGENKARCLVFDLTECVSTFGDGGFVISFIRQGDELPYLVTNTDRLDNNAIWIINSTDTAVDGYGMVQLQYIVDDVICKSALYRTVTFDSNGITGDVPDPYQDLLAQIAAYAAAAEGAATTATAAANTATTAVENGIVTERSQRIAADNGLQQQITNLMGLAGAPVMANTAAAMTDSTKIYIYTGSEAGYVFGNWYYFNGAEWASGGVYQASAVQTDPTLSVEGMAADAAATGDLKSQIYSAFVTESASGSTASFTDGADDVPLKDLVVNITPQQASGTPSPTNILPITGWTAANITRFGRNIMSDNLTNKTGSGVTFTVNNDKSVTINGTATTTIGFLLFNNHLKLNMFHGVTYHYGFTCDGSSEGISIQLYENGASQRTIESDTLGTYTPSENATTNYIRIRINSGATINNVTVYPVITTAPNNITWESPVSNTYTVSFSSAGTVYGGTLDVTSGMLTVTWAGTDMGSMTWEYNTAYSNPIMRSNSIHTRRYGTNADGIYGLCSAYAWATNGALAAMGNMDDKHFGFQSTNYWIAVRDDDYTDVETFKAAVAGQYIVYELETPVSYQLDPTEVRTLLGNNNIWSDTGSVESCEYRADTQLYIEKLTNPDNDMTADANIASGQYFMVNNTLYLATAAIASGATIVPGTNCTETSLAAALNAINA